MLWLVLLVSCSDVAPVEERAPGERVGRLQSCDDLDPTDCLLPWPSAAFTEADASRPSGLAVQIDEAVLPVLDDLSLLEAADGFSRASPLAVGFDVALGDVGNADARTDGVLQLFVAEPDHERYGEAIAVKTEVVDGSSLDKELSLLVAEPVELMPPNAEHVAVVTDAVGVAEVPRAVEVALDLVEPETDAEWEAWAYHAPTRLLLEDVGIDPTTVVRVWDFTTRSEEDGTRRLLHMVEETAAAEDDWVVQIDSIEYPESDALEAIVEGRLTGLPGFLDETGHYVLDADRLPTITGTREARFRLTVPNTDDYHVALYGHGTGGNVDDDAFDEELAAAGIAKLNLQFVGWTGDDVLETFFGFTAMVDGCSTSAAGLAEVLAGGTALLTAMEDQIPAALSELEHQPDVSEPVWVGGSLGGTTGAVFVGVEPRIETAVLNVPGAGWSHFLAKSYLYEMGLGDLMLSTYGAEWKLRIAIAMGQTAWDDADGVVWAERALEPGGVILLQESMGDPVLPNVGSELLANALGATQFSPVLEDVYGLEVTDGAVTVGAALQQFHVPDTGPYDVHGFAARDTEAGAAALEQMTGLLESYWAGSATVSAPESCVSFGCDFGDSW